MPTKPELWPMRKLLAAKGLVDPAEPIAIRIPKYQRGLVWEDEKKRQLIDSLIRRYPVGALLVSEVLQDKTSDGRPKPVYQLIDGLQRTQAIAEHLLEPLARITHDAVPPELLAELEGSLVNLGLITSPTDDLGTAIETWLHKVKVPDGIRGYTATGLLTHLDAELNFVGLDLPKVQALDSVVARVLQAVQSATDIGGIEIPVLVYSGDQAQLPEVFARLNKQGTTLSKYQIFAAAWVDDLTVALNPEIRKAIEAKYENLEAEGFEVEEQAGTDPTTVSLFEYMYGLSRHLNDKFPTLLRGEDGDGSDAFSLVTLARGQRLDKMDTLPTFAAARDAKDRIDPTRMEKALISSVEFVQDALAPYLGLQLSQAGRPAHGELQIVSIVAAAAAARYESTGDWKEVPKSTWRTRSRQLKVAIPQHYLLDLIRQAWRGPLYTLAYDRVWDTVGGAPTRSDFYLTPPARASWDGALSVWFEEQLGEHYTKRPNISALERTFLRFVYAPIVTVAAFNSHRFDVDHLIPVSRIVQIAKTDASGGWPIGCLANLALVDSSTNRRRRHETIPDYFARPASRKGPTASERAEMERYLLCAPSELAIPQVAGKDALTLADYDAFLRSRWKELVKALYRSLRI